MLQVVGSSDKILIKIQTFQMLVMDVGLVAEELLDSLEVTGTFEPQLLFKFKATVFDSYLLNRDMVKTTVALSWLEAYKLRRILKESYDIRLLWLMNGLISKVDVRLVDDDDDENDDDEERRPKGDKRLKSSGSMSQVDLYGSQGLKRSQTMPGKMRSKTGRSAARLNKPPLYRQPSAPRLEEYELQVITSPGKR
jgi:hypothetical protein